MNFAAIYCKSVEIPILPKSITGQPKELIKLIVYQSLIIGIMPLRARGMFGQAEAGTAGGLFIFICLIIESLRPRARARVFVAKLGRPDSSLFLRC